MCYLSSFLFLRLSAYRQSAHIGFPYKESAIAVDLSDRFVCYAPEKIGKPQVRGQLSARRYTQGVRESSYIVSLNGSVNWNIMRFKGTELYGRISFEAGDNNNSTTNRRAVWLKSYPHMSRSLDRKPYRQTHQKGKESNFPNSFSSRLLAILGL